MPETDHTTTTTTGKPGIHRRCIVDLALHPGEAMMSNSTLPAQAGSTAQLSPMLDDALAAYWDAAYAEGCEQRTHDTENGAAQTALLQVRVAVAAMVAAERERLALLAESRTDGYLSLTADEIRRGSL